MNMRELVPDLCFHNWFLLELPWQVGKGAQSGWVERSQPSRAGWLLGCAMQEPDSFQKHLGFSPRLCGLLAFGFIFSLSPSGVGLSTYSRLPGAGPAPKPHRCLGASGEQSAETLKGRHSLWSFNESPWEQWAKEEELMDITSEPSPNNIES